MQGDIIFKEGQRLALVLKMHGTEGESCEKNKQ